MSGDGGAGGRKGKRVDFEVPRAAARRRCSCGAEIVFTRTRRGGWMPLDMSTCEERAGALFAESHHAHCPEAARFRRPKIKGAPERRRW